MGTHIQVLSRILGANSSKYYFPSMFHFNRVGNGNDDISSEEHFKNSKTNRGSYLLIMLVSKYLNSIS
jgi:hypothetical protein